MINEGDGFNLVTFLLLKNEIINNISSKCLLDAASLLTLSISGNLPDFFFLNKLIYYGMEWLS